MRPTPLFFTSALIVVLAACASPSKPQPKPPKPPPGAIALGDGRYMAPRGPDASGCLQFSIWSPGRPAPAAFYFRRSDDGGGGSDGGFTLFRNEADCPKP